MAHGTRWDQIESVERQGDGTKGLSTNGTGATDKWPILFDATGKAIGEQPRGNTTVVQMSDQTGGFVLNDLLAFDVSGNAKDSGLLSTDVVTNPGGGTVLTASGRGSWYEQVPRGVVDGSNRVFTLDYKLVNPFAVLNIGGDGQEPAIQGDPANPFATIATPNPEFSIIDWTLTTARAPQPGEKFYIYYFRADPMAAVTSATITTWSAFTDPSGTGSHAFARISTVFPTGGPTGTDISVNNTATLYSLTEKTASPYLGTPADLTLETFAGFGVKFLLDGTLGGSAANEFHIYDLYLNLTLADSSIVTARPTSYTFDSGSDSTGTATSWQPGKNYATGVQVVDSNGNLQLATNTGTSGTAAPTWGMSGNTIDGSMVWSYNGAQTSSTGQISNPGAAYDGDATPPVTYAIFGRSHWGSLSTGGFVTFTNFIVVGIADPTITPIAGGSGSGGSGGSSSTTHAEVLVDASGNPIIMADGDWIYMTGVPN